MVTHNSNGTNRQLAPVWVGAKTIISSIAERPTALASGMLPKSNQRVNVQLRIMTLFKWTCHLPASLACTSEFQMTQSETSFLGWICWSAGILLGTNEIFTFIRQCCTHCDYFLMNHLDGQLKQHDILIQANHIKNSKERQCKNKSFY